MVLLWTEQLNFFMWTAIHELSRQKTIVHFGLFCVKSSGFVSPTSLFKPNIAWFSAQILKNSPEILLQSHPGRQIDPTEPDFPGQISSRVNRKCIRTALIWADIQLSVLRIFKYSFWIFKYSLIFEYSKIRYRTCAYTWGVIFWYSLAGEPISYYLLLTAAYPCYTFSTDVTCAVVLETITLQSHPFSQELLLFCAMTVSTDSFNRWCFGRSFSTIRRIVLVMHWENTVEMVWTIYW